MLPVIVRGFCIWVEEGGVADELWRVGPSGEGGYERVGEDFEIVLQGVL